MFRRFRSGVTQQVQAPAPGQAQPAAQAAPQPSPAPTQQDAINKIEASNATYNQPGGPGYAAQASKPAQGPQLSDAIALLKTGDRAGAEALMRQIVGLPALPVQGGPNPPPGQPGTRPPVMPAPVAQPPGLVNRTIVMGPAPGQSYKDYMDSRMKSYDPYAIGTNR